MGFKGHVRVGFYFWMPFLSPVSPQKHYLSFSSCFRKDALQDHEEILEEVIKPTRK